MLEVREVCDPAYVHGDPDSFLILSPGFFTGVLELPLESYS